MKHQRLQLIMLAAAVALMGLGCGPFQKTQDKAAEEIAEIALEKTGGGKAEIDTGGQTLVIKDNETGNEIGFGENVKIPDDFPEDMFIYPGAIAKSVIRSRTDGSDSINLFSSDGKTKVIPWYEDKYKSDGWKKETGYTLGEIDDREYSKGEVSIYLSFSPSDSGGAKGTKITILRREKK